MKSKDRSLRVLTAAALLVALKQNGLPINLAAEYMELSPTTLSNWMKAREAKDKRLGLPTDEHLQKLVVLLCYQLQQNMGVIHDFLNEEYVRPWEQILLLEGMLPTAEDFVSRWRADSEGWDAYIDDIKRLAEKHGAKAITATLGHVDAHYITEKDASGRPLPDDQPHMMIDSDELLANISNAEEQIREAKIDLEEFFQKRNKQYLAKGIAKQKEQKNRRTKKSR